MAGILAQTLLCPGCTVAHPSEQCQVWMSRPTVLRRSADHAVSWRPCRWSDELSRATGPRRRSVRPLMAQSSVDTSQPHVQLATAKLPKSIQVERFRSELFQWANTLTSTSGRQMPFSLPLRITPKGASAFEMSFLRSQSGYFVSEGNIVVSTEEEAGVGPVLYMRFFEGEASPRKGQSQEQRLQSGMSRLIDLPTIMKLFPAAIREISGRCTP